MYIGSELAAACGFGPAVKRTSWTPYDVMASCIALDI